jgi:multidrug resistance efflux pump
MGDDGSNPPRVEVEAARREAPAKAEPANPMGRVTIVVLAIAVVLFAYHLVADRFTPFTDQATVQAFIVNIAPDVGGRVRSVRVADNQPVRAGDVLFVIDPERYQIALQTAEAQLASAGQAVGASTAALTAAEARLAASEANRINVQQQTARVFELVDRGVRPKADGDSSRAGLRSAVADVARAKADVEQARQNLGPIGANAQIQAAQAAIRQARRDLADTVVRAPSDGEVTNLQLAAGRFVGAGQTALTFVDRSSVWIEAQVRENSLEHIKVGDAVGISLDVRPGRVYRGRVQGVGRGVDNSDIDPATGLPVIKNDSGWIRDPQRFAVRVALDPDSRFGDVRVGSQASLVIYTGRSGITDSIGRLWIALVSYLSYVN